jgi:sugar/nucleoside kinase (ribokinase family)
VTISIIYAAINKVSTELDLNLVPRISLPKFIMNSTECSQCTLYVELKQGVKQVLVKLGSQGSALFIEGEETIRQTVIPASEVADTTGAGGTFSAAFAVALVEGRPKIECLRFSGTVYKFTFQWSFLSNLPILLSIF